MPNIKIVNSDIVTAFNSETIGTKVIDAEAFWKAVEPAILDNPFSCERVPGQGFLVVREAVPFVSSGVGLNRDDPSAYVLRSHRGKVHHYLKREFAAPVEACAVVVYTREAYLADPDINESPGEAERIKAENPDYVLVAVLAFAGPKSTLSPYRFVKNLAGGNHEALVWTADEIRAKAREIATYTDEWSMVAD